MGHIAGMDMACVTLAFIDGLGAPEMVLIFVVVLVLFGGQKLPEFARGLGKSIREFKKAAAGVEEEFKRALEEDERKQAAAQLPAPSATPAAGTTPPLSDPGGPEAQPYQHDEYHDNDYYHDETYGGETGKKPDPNVAGGQAAANPAPTGETSPETGAQSPTGAGPSPSASTNTSDAASVPTGSTPASASPNPADTPTPAPAPGTESPPKTP